MTTNAYAPAPSYQISGIGPYDAPFEYASSDEITVSILVGDVLETVAPADYSVIPEGPTTTGAVFLSPAYATAHDGETLVLARDTTLDQSWIGLGSTAMDLEAQLDEIARAVQENQTAIAGSLRVISDELSAYQPQDGRVPYWDATLGSFANGLNYSELEDGINAANAASESVDVALHALNGGKWRSDAAGLFADVDLTYTTGQVGTVAEGDKVVTQAENFVFEVADSAASDHHVTTSGGVKLYVVPDSSGYYDAGAFGVIADGVTDDTNAWDAAVLACLENKQALRMPKGRCVLASGNKTYTVPAHQTFRMFSEGEAEIFFDFDATNITFTTEVATTCLLAADAARGDAFLVVDDATGIEIGDTLYVQTATAVESGWNYPKTCIRKVTSLDGTTIWIDQSLDFFFTAAEVTEILVTKPAHFESDGISYFFISSAAGGSRFRLYQGMGGIITNGRAEGETAGWSTEYSDGFIVPICDGVIFDNFDFTNLRYPGRIAASRDIQVRNCNVKGIRHIDASAWAQDILYENIRGIDTDGIIQCHPAIRPTWRNVHDSVTATSLYELGLRGLGETVEDCSAVSLNADYSQNTNAPLLNADYLEMAKEYTRRIIGMKTNRSGVAAGKEGTLIVESSDVGYIARAAGFSNADVSIYVDEATRIARPFDPNDRSEDSAVDNIVMSKPVYLTPVSGYETEFGASPLDITGVTQANPGVVTVTGHGLSDGDVVWISGLAGMIEANQFFYKVANSTANTFELTDLDDAPVDTSSFTAYTSGGKCTKQAAVDCVDVLTAPNVGNKETLRIRSKIYGETAHSSTSISKRINFRSLPGGEVSTAYRFGKLTIRAQGRSGFATAVYEYGYGPANFGLPGVTLVEQRSYNGMSVAISDTELRTTTNVIAEGESSSTPALRPEVNHRYWIGFQVDVSLSSVTQHIRNLEIEVEEWAS